MHVKFQDEYIGSGNMPHTANSKKSKNQHPSFDLLDIESQTPDGSKEAAAAATCPVHKVTIPQCALNIACLDLRRQEVGFKMIINCCRSLVKWNLETCYSRQLLFVSPDTKTLCNELCVCVWSWCSRWVAWSHLSPTTSMWEESKAVKKRIFVVLLNKFWRH